MDSDYRPPNFTNFSMEYLPAGYQCSVSWIKQSHHHAYYNSCVHQHYWYVDCTMVTYNISVIVSLLVCSLCNTFCSELHVLFLGQNRTVVVCYVCRLWCAWLLANQVGYIIARVDNKEREEYPMRYMLRTRCLHRVTWLSALRTWLALGAKHLIFLRTIKNRGIFVSFVLDSSWLLVLYCYLLAFSVEIVLALAYTQGHAHDVPFDVSALIGQFWIPGMWLSAATLYGAYSTLDTLLSLLFTLDNSYSTVARDLWLCKPPLSLGYTPWSQVSLLP